MVLGDQSCTLDWWTADKVKFFACFYVLENPEKVFLCETGSTSGIDLKPIGVYRFDLEDHFATHIGYLQLLTSPTSGFPFFETICS